jgi:type I restriction enzyme R subunit
MTEKLKHDKFDENELEQAIIELFKEQEYPHVRGKAIHKRVEDVLLLEDLRSFISKRYAGDNLSEVEIRKVINKLNLIPSSPLYSGNREAFWLVNEGFDLIREDPTRVALHVDYIDFGEPENNIFKVVNQYSVRGEPSRCPDLLLFINGIPVAIFEFKTAIRENKTIHDAWEQITNRYNRDIPKLMKYCFLSVISDGANTKLGSIFTPYEFYYSWNKVNDTEKVSNGISSLRTMIKGAFTKERIIKILRDFVFYPDDSNKDKAIICRYPQFFAAQKMLGNIKKHLRPVGDGKGGTYFGAPGCGKTFTMLFLSRLIALRDNEAFNNPTIIILVDREGLDTQTTELFVTANKYLHEKEVRSIENREDMEQTLRDKPSGGIYITTIQKFCEKTGLLSDRANIICISDEAHRTQTGIGSKLKKTEAGVFTSFGFAKYLRDSFPNATYCGFTGTPIDETISVFGGVIDSYTMKESRDDGITVGISYESRLARVILSDEQAKEIEKYYDQCVDEGSNPEQVEKSKRAMSSMATVLGHPDRIEKLASDIVSHYEALCDEKPQVVQKAMIVCADRQLAFKVLKAIEAIRPGWTVAKKAEDESKLDRDQLSKLVAIPKINMVATQGVNDEKELYDVCGTKEYRAMLDKQFKNADSNFRVVIVVDMWITGFDIASLAVMYIDKPLQKHTLIQTISRVNRIFEGKDKGLIVDYIGIKKDMMEALKKYGMPQESPIEELTTSLSIFRSHLTLVNDLLSGFNAKKYYEGTPLERLNCLGEAAEYVQVKKGKLDRFMGFTRTLKNAYRICVPSGELTIEEINKAQFYMAIRSIIYKQTKGDAPDAEVMNQYVEKMVQEAIECTGIESIFDEKKSLDIFSDKFLAELNKIKLPMTKFNALLKFLWKAIAEYGRTNKVKALEFSERLRDVVEAYNSRDEVELEGGDSAEFVNELSGKLIEMMRDLETDKSSFEKLGITNEEKAFYDILVKVSNEHHFQCENEKCLVLAKEIKRLFEENAEFADWSIRSDIRGILKKMIIVLLDENGYPSEFEQEIFDQVMQQAVNF